MRTKIEQIALWYKPFKEGRNFNAIIIVFMALEVYRAQVLN